MPEFIQAPAFLAKCAADVEHALAAAIDGLHLPDNLADAIRYSSLDGGKRLRPTLTILCCEASGGDRANATAAACAIELMHCFSLVHDDLPAMDDDTMRRGKPTLHKHANEAMAILAGDSMLAASFQILADAALDAEKRIALTRELADATQAMIAGQVYDMLGGTPQGGSDEDRLLLIHRHKTGALLRCACRIGAISAGADSDGIDRLTGFGEAIGLMFQAVDDMLDVTQSAEHLGKASGKDHGAGKLTFPGLFGVQGTRDRIEALRAQAGRLLKPLGERGRHLRELADFLAGRTC